MKMTAKDYKTVAKIFRDASEKMDKGEITTREKLFKDVTSGLSDVFQENNPNFDPKRFLNACRR